MKKFQALSLSDVVFIMLINVKIVGILTFMSRINFELSCVDHIFITSGPADLEYGQQRRKPACAPSQSGQHLSLFNM